MSLIAREMVIKSSYVDDMRGKVAREGVISPSFAAFFVDEMLLELEEWDYESDSEQETVDYGYKLRTNSQYTCACGVILYMLLCGPPKNDVDQRFRNFYNHVGLGVHVNPSSWFGSVHKRKTWCHLDEFSHKCILKMVHIDCYNYNGVYSSSGEARSDVFFRHGPPSIVLHQELELSSTIVSTAESMITVQAYKRKKYYGSTRNHIIRTSTDISAFKEILNIQKKDMAEFKATKAIKGVPTTELETTDMWNGFWTAAAKMQKRKRKKSLTVSEKKKGSGHSPKNNSQAYGY